MTGNEEGIVAYYDMDGTLADYEGAMLASLEELRAPEEPLPTVRHDIEQPPHILARMKLIKSKGEWWENLPRFQLGWDVYEITKRLGFRHFILTQGPRKNPIAWSHKLRWIMKELPEIENVCITRDKGLNYGRLLVDDYPEYVERWLKHRPRGAVIMPAHPYNEGFEHPGVVRYDGTNLDEVEHLVKWARYRDDGQSYPDSMKGENDVGR